MIWFPPRKRPGSDEMKNICAGYFTIAKIENFFKGKPETFSVYFLEREKGFVPVLKKTIFFQNELLQSENIILC